MQECCDEVCCVHVKTLFLKNDSMELILQFSPLSTILQINLMIINNYIVSFRNKKLAIFTRI